MAGILTYALHDDEGNFNKNSLGAISEAAKLAGEVGGEAAALDQLRLRGPGRELDLDVDHLGRAAALLRVEGVEPADDDAGLADVA
ncbi:MAG TPA: hypothetical protein VIS95_00745, partial [Solirubrobacterales bacterium]